MIELNIYKEGSKTEVEKTYSKDGYELMLGTVDDFLNVIDIEKIGDNIEVAKMIFKCYKKIIPLLKDIFPEASDDELRRTKVNDLVKTIKQVGEAIVDGFGVLKTGN